MKPLRRIMKELDILEESAHDKKFLAK